MVLANPTYLSILFWFAQAASGLLEGTEGLCPGNDA